jgi:3-hydroxyisobutyrate dehydrogenase-like beta-hydroxyacid dehydrogenase
MSSQPRDTRCAVIGLGVMGSALARALLAAGYPVTVWNRSSEKCVPLVELGAAEAASLNSAIESAELIVTCVKSPTVTRELLAGDGVGNALSGRTLIELATGDPRVRIEIAEWVQANNAEYLGGTIEVFPSMIGTPDGSIEVWGSGTAFRRYEDALQAFGAVRYSGNDVRAEEVLQAAGTTMLHAVFSCVFEACAYAASNGVDLRRLQPKLGPINEAAFIGAMMSVDNIAAGKRPEEAVEASITTWEASLAPVVDAKRADGLEPRIAEACLANLREAIATGLGGRDIDALFDLYLQPARTSVSA